MLGIYFKRLLGFLVFIFVLNHFALAQEESEYSVRKLFGNTVSNLKAPAHQVSIIDTKNPQTLESEDYQVRPVFQQLQQEAVESNIELAQNKRVIGENVLVESLEESKIKTKEVTSKIEGDQIIPCDKRKGSKSKYLSSFDIRTQYVDFLKSPYELEEAFSIEFWDDENESWLSDRLGVVREEFSHSEPQSIRMASIREPGFVTTHFEVIYDNSHLEITVPLIEKEAFKKLQNKERIKGIGGSLLFNLDEDIDDVKNSDSFEAKTYLNESFQAVNPSLNEYSYILLSGVDPGMMRVQFIGEDRIKYEKEYFVFEDELTFDIVQPMGVVEKKQNLCVSFPYQQKLSEYNIYKESFESLRYSTIKKLGLNTLLIENSNLLYGAQEFVALKKSKNPLLLFSPFRKGQLSIPSVDDVDYILGAFDIGDSFYGCMVQVNLSKKPKLMSSRVFDDRGENYLTYLALHEDGMITKDIFPQTKKIYLFAPEKGLISTKIEYLDGSYDYLSTYCMEKSYIVENL